MNKYVLNPGEKFVLDKEYYLLLEIVDEHVVLQNIRKNRNKVIRTIDFEADLLRGVIKRVQDVSNPQLQPKILLEHLSEKTKKEAGRRLQYVKKVKELSGGLSMRKFLGDAIREVSEDIDDNRPPSVATVYRWYKEWVAGGETIFSLITSHKTKRNRKKGLSDEVKDIITEVIEEKYMVFERPPLSAVIPDIEVAILKRNKGREKSKQLEIPSKATIYRHLERMDQYEITLKRYGKYIADRKFKFVGVGITAEAPLDIVQVDHTLLDIQALESSTMYTARPILTIFLDLYSRMPIGFYLGFSPPSYAAVMEALHASILPKENLLKKYKIIKGGWVCQGIPRLLILDNGLEFHSTDLQEACLQLGISTSFNPVRTPHYKGAVERFFGTVNTNFLSKLKGKTFSNVVEKKDYNSVARAAITLEDLQAVFTKWIVDVYARKFHSGIEDMPCERWKAGVKKFPVDLPSNPDDLIALLSTCKERTLSNKGIEIHSTRYNSEELTKLFCQYGRKRKVKVKVDPAELGHIYVYNDLAEAYITVPCLKEEFIGISSWEYKIARSVIAEKKRAGEKTCNVAEALVAIHDYVNERSTGKKKSNRNIARLKSYKKKAHKKESKVDQTFSSIDFDTNFDGLENYLKTAMDKGWGSSDETEE